MVVITEEGMRVIACYIRCFCGKNVKCSTFLESFVYRPPVSTFEMKAGVKSFQTTKVEEELSI